MKKMISIAFLLTILATGAISVSAGTLYPPEGGHWNYGVGFSGTYSDYRHDQRYHMATVIKGNTRNDGYGKAGSWAKANLFVFGGASCYYGFPE